MATGLSQMGRMKSFKFISPTFNGHILIPEKEDPKSLNLRLLNVAVRRRCFYSTEQEGTRHLDSGLRKGWRKRQDRGDSGKDVNGI
jgi:hypothetical protein